VLRVDHDRPEFQAGMLDDPGAEPEILVGHPGADPQGQPGPAQPDVSGLLGPVGAGRPSGSRSRRASLHVRPRRCGRAGWPGSPRVVHAGLGPASRAST
jgi:hypothetical protein